MHLGIDRTGELIQEHRSWQLLGLPLCERHSVCHENPWRHLDLRAPLLKQRNALAGHQLMHGEEQRVAANRGNKGQSDPGVPSRGGNDHRTGLQHPLLLGVVDESQQPAGPSRCRLGCAFPAWRRGAREGFCFVATRSAACRRPSRSGQADLKLSGFPAARGFYSRCALGLLAVSHDLRGRSRTRPAPETPVGATDERPPPPHWQTCSDVRARPAARLPNNERSAGPAARSLDTTRLSP